MKSVYTALLCHLFVFGMGRVYAQVPAESPSTPMLQNDTYVFPLTLINAFPFITAEVNGQVGKLMFDTGINPPISLNTHRLQLPPGKAIGQGKVTSGQQFTSYEQDTIADVKFTDGPAYKNLRHVRSGNYSYLEGITPDAIGYVGFEFFQGYLFKLDYTRRQVTFYRDTPARRSTQDFLRGEKVVAVLHFEVRKLARIPILKVKVGDQELIGSFDTGQDGGLTLSESTRQSLLRQGLLTRLDGNSAMNIGTLRQVRFAEGLQVDLPALDFLEPNQARIVTTELQIPEPNKLGLGYRFLAQYTTVWDYPRQQIYVLAK